MYMLFIHPFLKILKSKQSKYCKSNIVIYLGLGLSGSLSTIYLFCIIENGEAI